MKKIKNAVGITLVAGMLMFTASTGIGETMEFTGTIEQKGDIVVLFSPDGTYVLKGSDMLPKMIGKKVQVAGTVEQKDQVRILTVESFEEVAEE